MKFHIYSAVGHEAFSLKSLKISQNFNPIALRKAKIVYNFGLSECNRVKTDLGFGIALVEESLFYRRTAKQCNFGVNLVTDKPRLVATILWLYLL